MSALRPVLLSFSCRIKTNGSLITFVTWMYYTTFENCSHGLYQLRIQHFENKELCECNDIAAAQSEVLGSNFGRYTDYPRTCFYPPSNKT
jgi:hypothetical protein